MKIIKGIILSFKKNPFFNSIDESVSIIEDGGILIDNGLIKKIFDEEGGGLEKSSAENLLKNL